MTWAPQQTQISLYNHLRADSALMVLLGTTVNGTQKIFDHIPDNSSFPYLQIETKPWEDRGNHCSDGLSGLIFIHTWYQAGASSSFTGRGDKQVQLIQSRIDELLHKKYIAISGWSTLQLRREFIDILVDPDNVTLHGIQRFKILLGGN